MILQNIQTAQLHISRTLELLLVLLFLLYSSGPIQHRILVSVRAHAEDFGSLAVFTEHPAVTSVVQQKSCDDCSFLGKLLHSPGSLRCPAGPAVTYLGVICSRH